jgi:hypothetical protein
MTPAARLTEVGTLLATGLRRYKEKEKQETFPLDNSPDQWLHGRKSKRKTGEKP